LIDGIMNWKYFGLLMDAMSLADNIPGWMMNQLTKYLKDEYGITLTTEQLRHLLSVFESTNDYMDEIKVISDGRDITVSTSDFSSFSINPDRIRGIPEDMKLIPRRMAHLQGELEGVSTKLRSPMGMSVLRVRLKKMINRIENETKSCRKMGEEMERIIKIYADTENRIVGRGVSGR